MKPLALLVSCEHASNHVPKEYASLFHEEKKILKTHEAYDLGALEVAEHISSRFSCPLILGAITRLLIDLNRSLTNPQFLSDYSRSLSTAQKEELIRIYYHPYRKQVENLILNFVEDGYQVLHLAIHSFTPVLGNIKRNADIGFLYDPKRHAETEVVRLWASILHIQHPEYAVRKNYPYRGDTDGLTTTLRKLHDQSCYLGIEIECNQKMLAKKKSFEMLNEVLSNSLKELLLVL